jgi:hypothetical protein
MKNIKQTLQVISYLQYPSMLLGLYFCLQPLITNNLDLIWGEYNKALVFLGVGLSFSTLQDTEKVQNTFSKKIYQDPLRAKMFLLLIAIQIVFFIGFGVFGLFFSTISAIKDVSLGSITIGIGMMGILKGASEMAAYQQKMMIEDSAKG